MAYSRQTYVTNLGIPVREFPYVAGEIGFVLDPFPLLVVPSPIALEMGAAVEMNVGVANVSVSPSSLSVVADPPTGEGGVCPITTQFLRLGDTPALDHEGGPITFGGWAKFNDLSGRVTIVSKYEEGLLLAEEEYILSVVGNVLTLELYTSGGVPNTLTHPVSLSINRWYYVGFFFDLGTAILALGGAQSTGVPYSEATQFFPGFPALTHKQSHLRFAATVRDGEAPLDPEDQYTGLTDFLSGSFDEWGMWFENVDMQPLWNNGVPITFSQAPTTEMIGYWNFDQTGTPQFWNDASPNSLSLKGFPVADPPTSCESSTDPLAIEFQVGVASIVVVPLEISLEGLWVNIAQILIGSPGINMDDITVGSVPVFVSPASSNLDDLRVGSATISVIPNALGLTITQGITWEAPQVLITPRPIYFDDILFPIAQISVVPASINMDDLSVGTSSIKVVPQAMNLDDVTVGTPTIQVFPQPLGMSVAVVMTMGSAEIQVVPQSINLDDITMGVPTIRVVPVSMNLDDLVVGVAVIVVRPAPIVVDDLLIGIPGIKITPPPITVTVGVELTVDTAVIFIVPQSIVVLAGIEVELTVEPPTILVVPPLITVNSGNDPVYTWKVPDRQCVGSVDSGVIVMQPFENIWVSFDFAQILDNNESSLNAIVYVTDELGYIETGTDVIEGTEVKFKINVPFDSLEVDNGIEVAVQDTKNNRHVADGLLRIRKGTKE